MQDLFGEIEIWLSMIIVNTFCCDVACMCISMCHLRELEKVGLIEREYF